MSMIKDIVILIPDSLITSHSKQNSNPDISCRLRAPPIKNLIRSKLLKRKKAALLNLFIYLDQKVFEVYKTPILNYITK